MHEAVERFSVRNCESFSTRVLFVNLISSDKDVLFVFRAQLLEEKKIIEIKKVQKSREKYHKIIQKRNAKAGSAQLLK